MIATPKKRSTHTGQTENAGLSHNLILPLSQHVNIHIKEILESHRIYALQREFVAFVLAIEPWRRRVRHCICIQRSFLVQMPLSLEDREELLNFLRFCWILMDGVRTEMAQLFTEQIQRESLGNFKEACKKLSKYSEFKKLARNKNQIQIVLGGDITKWDITLLASYLRMSSFCMLCHPGVKLESEKESNKWELESELPVQEDCQAMVKFEHSNKHHNTAKLAEVSICGIENGKHTIIIKGKNENIQLIKGAMISVVTHQWHIIDEIREMRNIKYGHVTSPRMDKDEFDENMRKIEDIYEAFPRWKKESFKAIKNETFCDKSNDAIMECVEMWYEVKNALLEQQGNQQQSLLEIKETLPVILRDLEEHKEVLSKVQEEVKKVKDTLSEHDGKICEHDGKICEHDSQIRENAAGIKNLERQKLRQPLDLTKKIDVFVFSRYEDETEKTLVTAITDVLNAKSKLITPFLQNWEDVVEYVKKSEFLIYFMGDKFIDDEVGHRMLLASPKYTHIICKKPKDKMLENVSNEEVIAVWEKAIWNDYDCDHLRQLATEIVNTTLEIDGQVFTESQPMISVEMVSADLMCISADWDNFGINVGLDMNVIDKIGADSKKTNCFNKVLSTWLKGKKELVTKEILVKAVKAAGNTNLANKISLDPKLQFSMPYLKKKLAPVRYNYNILGLHLHVKQDDIKEFETVRCNTDHFMNEVIMKWFEEEGEYMPSMELLKEALKEIHQIGLYEDLEKKYEDYIFPA